ncbi:MAG: 4Fe-4S binding protein [Candidatus Delongbacteria bacterium]|jgi:NosR/NirI family nitrous oxide reductase transcriptional regulator|nr:4Fe-4S binding protein [Candidatus Delongbacteria bacterium]
MKKNLIRVLQLIVLIGLLVLIRTFHAGPSEDNKHLKTDDTGFIEHVYGEKIQIRSDTSDLGCNIFKDGKQAGYVLYSSELENQTRGYVSPLDFAVLLDEDMRIKNIELLSYGDETPSYIQWLKRDGFFDQWNGMIPKEVLEKETKIITGATLSCQAVSIDLQRMMSCFADYQEQEQQMQTNKMLKNIAILLFLGFAVMHFFFKKKLAKTRWILLLASVLILGIWGGRFISMSLLYGWLMNGVVLEMQFVLLAIFVISVGLPLITGKSFYCTYVCPFGAAQELVGKLNKNKKPISKTWKTFFRWFRLVVFVLILVLLLAGITLPLSDIEPFSVFRIQAASLAVIILAAVMLVLSVFIAKPWCRYACPTGMFFELFRKPVLNENNKPQK